MSGGGIRAATSAAELREEFDRSFAAAPVVARVVFDGFLAIRVGGDPYAVRLSDIASLHHDRKVVPIQSAVPELLGLAAFRGIMAPVYDLRALLGYAGGPAPRWLLLSGAPPVGLAFDLCEAHLRVARENVSGTETEGSIRRHLDGAVHGAEATRPIIRIASVLEAIARRAPQGGPRKER